MKRHIHSAEGHEIQSGNQYRVPTRDGIELGAAVTRPIGTGRLHATRTSAFEPER